MEVKVITWNVYHGRDAPPNPALDTWRSRLTRRTERDATHAQVNRDLLAGFTAVLARTDWDVALLQECPPRWRDPLAAALGADAHAVPTSRNRAGRLRSALAKLNPDLMASAEGGSNLTLVRGRHAPIVLRRELTLRPEPGVVDRMRGAPERRVMAFTECGSGLCVANLHATNDRPDLAATEVMRAAEAATRWAGHRPLLLGGDFNLRPARHPEVFASLASRHELSAPSELDAIDHVLARGLVHLAPPASWALQRREIVEGHSRIRLSDHAPVEARLIRA